MAAMTTTTSMLCTNHPVNNTNLGGSDIPVCNGAGCIAAQLVDQPLQVPDRAMLGWHQDERYDRHTHGDIELDSELIEESYIGDGKVLELVGDRWKKILDKVR